jgi:hypothetical protein
MSRSLLAWKAVLESKWFNKYASTTIVVSSQDDGKVKVVSGGKNAVLWHTFVDIHRAFLQFVSSGIQYLL